MPLVKCCPVLQPLTGNPTSITTRFLHAGINHRSGSQHSDWLAAGQHRCGTGIIFDNDEDKTDSAVLLPWIEQAQTMFAISAIFSFCNRPEQLATEPTHHTL
jgi:hypothetical protein